ncbi:RNA-binding protein 48 [Blomia tropicalis]|nr:RNA-binding protein 48 [Blomia tropicalis]
MEPCYSKRIRVLLNDNNKDYIQKSIVSYPHHVRQELCTTREVYRCGKRETAVKVFTIADESVYILVQNVPLLNGVNIKNDLEIICSRFGVLDSIEPVKYETKEAFCQTFLVKYVRLVDAIRAKKSLDDHIFLGSSLHICYAPEFESVEETLAKVNSRQRYVHIKMAQLKNLSK